MTKVGKPIVARLCDRLYREVGVIHRVGAVRRAVRDAVGDEHDHPPVVIGQRGQMAGRGLHGGAGRRCCPRCSSRRSRSCGPRSRPLIELASPSATATVGPAATVQGPARSSGTSLRPQPTVDCVCATTSLIAAVACAHLEVAPQPPEHVWLVASQSIDADAVTTTNTSSPAGGAGRFDARAIHTVAGAAPVMPPTTGAAAGARRPGRSPDCRRAGPRRRHRPACRARSPRQMPTRLREPPPRPGCSTETSPPRQSVRRKSLTGRESGHPFTGGRSTGARPAAPPAARAARQPGNSPRRSRRRRRTGTAPGSSPATATSSR